MQQRRSFLDSDGQHEIPTVRVLSGAARTIDDDARKPAPALAFDRTGVSFIRWGLLPLRVAVGIVFLMHGGQKLFVFGLAGTADILAKLGLPFAALLAVIVIAVELLGGVSIIFGLFTRLFGGLLAFEMVVAIIVARLHGGFFAPYGYEFEMTLLAACLTFAATGPGSISVEELRRGSSSR